MVKTLLTKAASVASHIGFVACLIAGLASGLSFARDDDSEPLSSCSSPSVTEDPYNCTVAAPDKTCYDYQCLSPPTIPIGYACVCTPQCNKSCACVWTPVPGC